MELTGAKAVVKCLLEQGVDTVFGYPGGMILPLYDALYDETAIRQVLNFHEQGAAHAADGYARASGNVGVCIATSGPGAANLVTGIATAFMDSVPLIAITGQVETSLLGRDAFQEVDIMGVTMPITKHNFQIKSADKLVATLRLAFKVARSGRPGPVLVDIPRDIFTATVEFTPEAAAVCPARWQPPAETLSLLGEAAAALSGAQKPLIIAGGGVISAGASDELLALAEKFNLPVVTTLMGLGGFPGSHAQFLGMTGMHGLKEANSAVYEADVVLAIGCRFADRLTGNRDKYAKDKCIIHIDIDPAEIDKNVVSTIGLSGDMKVLLRLLADKASIGELSLWWMQLDAWRGVLYKMRYDSAALNVPWAMRALARYTRDRNVVFITDVGQHQMWAAQHLCIDATRGWITSGGLGTMGFGLPAALGAQIALGDTARVVHIAGDGGIKMTGNEYYTIAGLKLPVISIIVNNSGLGMIRQLQRVFYKERYIACELADSMDFVMYANSFGIEGRAANTPDEFKSALEWAFDRKLPSVIVLNVKSGFVEPMAKAGAAINEFVEF